jgi:hypothetical protein
MSIAITIIAFVGIILYVFFGKFFQHKSISRKLILLAFAAKIIAGSALFSIYSIQYSDRTKADIFVYFDNGMVMKEALSENPKQFVNLLISDKNTDQKYLQKMNRWGTSTENIAFGDNKFISRINGLLCVLGNGSYAFNQLIFIIFSFFGLWIMFLFFERFLPDLSKFLFFIVFFLPSSLLWTSGILKESLIILALGITLWSFLKFWEHQNKYFLLFLFFISVIIIIKTRMLFGIIFFPLAIAFLIDKKNMRKSIFIISTAIILMTLPFIGSYFASEHGILNTISQKQNAFYQLAIQENSGSLVNNIHLTSSPFSYISQSPKALFNVLLQPISFDLLSLKFISFLENIFIILLIIAILFNSNFQKTKTSIWLFSFIFSMFYLVSIGLAVPIIGALVRYKIFGIYFLLFSMLLLLHQNSKPFKLLSKL